MRTCILMAVLAAACRAQLLPPDVSHAPSTPASSTPTAAIGPDTVIVTVGGLGVTAGDIAKMMRYASPQQVQLFQQNPQQAIANAYMIKYLAAEAEKAHLEQKEDTKEAIDAMLALQRESILAGAMVNEVTNGYPVGPDQIGEFYKKNQSRWESAKIKIILIGFKPTSLSCVPKKDQSLDEKLAEATKCQLEAANSPYTRTQEEAHTLADDLVKQLRGGADFAKLVEKYSDDKESKASGGDFGPPIKTTSSYAQELKKVIFAMKQGQISDPIQEGYSYYIIRLEQMSVEPLDDVAVTIATEIRNTHMNDYMNDLGKRLTPQVVRPEFFLQPQKYLSPAAPPAK